MTNHEVTINHPNCPEFTVWDTGLHAGEFGPAIGQLFYWDASTGIAFNANYDGRDYERSYDRAKALMVEQYLKTVMSPQ